MQIDTKEIGKATLLQVSGEVDMSNSPQVREKLIGFIKKKAPAILVDLGGVTYMDSSGIATLVEGLQETMGYGGKFRLVSLTPKVRQVFDLARLTDVFEIYPDLPSAQEGL
ncbi:MAG: STAS domain-containing protein [Candidatus Tectomicrobia bacterium]|uniref:Anti-sigma factor antagonist n=1 Tax=Tectimicrobiota bacterium TaxID=2528274 RepID=A0A932I005_UNCTE|nr:STAS domain-containing protein [Candidatus Tectomicrobia bacterium]